MEHIHKKSVLAETSDLLLAAHDRGIHLLWDRYEQQLPLCAFTSNGLSCRKCFQGPCRISPFGDEPSQGACGADRDQIVMENIFQSTLEGVLESARSAKLLGVGTDQDLLDIASGLSQATQERLTKAGLLPVRKGDLLGVQNSFFSHKGYLAHTLKELTRLGLIHYGLLKQTASAITRARSEESPFDPQGINLLIAGQAPAGLVQALEQAGQKAGGKKINVLVQGAHRLSSIMAAADHGSPELALGMNVDALLVAPNAVWPGLEPLAAQYGIPVILTEEGKSLGQTASEAIDQASRHSQNAFYAASSRMIQAGGAGAGSALLREQELKKALDSGRISGVAVLFGEANAKQAFFDRTLALMEAALGEKALILLGGDLGSQGDALYAELGKRKSGQLSSFASDLEKDGLRPISCFGSAFEIPMVVSWLNTLSQGRGGVGAFPAVIAFPEFFRSSTWASAVSLLSLGFTVQIGIRLPFWGSPWLTQVLKAEWEKISGGTLLAAPSLPDPRAQAEEMASLLRARRVR
jgi:hydroxylamine reductase (hybrid-cluster protein)